MKFAEMPYQRVDTDAVVAALKELTQKMKTAKSSFGFIRSFMRCGMNTIQ